MLYLSTRDSNTTYTAARVLSEGRAPDGGLFVPYYTARFPQEELNSLGGRKFNDTVARLLNLQFQTRLTEHDVRLAVGRSPVRIRSLNNRLLVGECWHNLEGEFSCLVANLARQLGQDTAVKKGSWTEVGIGTAVLFGIFAELMGRGLASEEKKVDVSLVSADFSLVMSCWFARSWGLPIGDIVCCCNENNALWNLFANGQLRTDGISVPTLTPEADVCVPESLERLIFLLGGARESEKYVDCVRRGVSYYPEEGMLQKLRQGIYVSVVSSRRMVNTIPNAHATHGYLFSTYSALAYAGLMDYQSKNSGARTGLVLARHSPLSQCEAVAAALGITPEELKQQFE